MNFGTIHKENHPTNWKTLCGFRKPNRANSSTQALEVDFTYSKDWTEVTCEVCHRSRG